MRLCTIRHASVSFRVASTHLELAAAWIAGGARVVDLPSPLHPTSTRLVVAPVQPRRGQMVVHVRGEVDATTAPRLRGVLEQAVVAVASEARVDDPAGGDDTAPTVVCDLDGVDFLCAAGLTVVQRVDLLARARGVRFAVVATTRPVRRIVELTGFDSVVPLLPVSPLPALPPPPADLGVPARRAV
jgi:anti-sigma B factor antagonist